MATPARDPVREDFRNFLYLMWKFLRLPDPTPVPYDIAHYLQHGPRRRMVQAFRGVGKSWITAAFVLWRLYKNPNERIMVVSASKERADAFSTFLKRLIAEWELLTDLRPEPGMRDSNIAFDVGGTRFSAPTGSERATRWWAYWGSTAKPWELIPTVCFGTGAGLVLGLLLYAAGVRVRRPAPPAEHQERVSARRGAPTDR